MRELAERAFARAPPPLFLDPRMVWQKVVCLANAHLGGVPLTPFRPVLWQQVIRAANVVLEGIPCAPFRPMSWQEIIYVANVHLEGAPSRPMDRVSQMKSVLRRLQQRQQQLGVDPSRCSVVIAGDFNSQADHAVCQLLYR